MILEELVKGKASTAKLSNLINCSTLVINEKEISTFCKVII